jgi:hypothetical protein
MGEDGIVFDEVFALDSAMKQSEFEVYAAIF